jgi:hypothetical protein
MGSMTQPPYQWVPIAVASRLLGLDYSVCLKRAKQNRYGMTRKSSNRSDGIEVSTAGLELAACRLFGREQIQAAFEGRKVPPFHWSADDLRFDDDIPKRVPPLEVIGATIAQAVHVND